MTATVDELLNIPTAPIPPPLNDYNTTTFTDPNVLAGATWVNDISLDGTINSYRRATYKKWLLSVMVGQQKNIQEKLTLFWSNHFGTESDTINYGTMIYNHHQILRNNCAGNFK